jgi:hypothetical protein
MYKDFNLVDDEADAAQALPGIMHVKSEGSD